MDGPLSPTTRGSKPQNTGSQKTPPASTALLTAHGLAVVGGTPLFRLASHPSADRIADTLGRHGILVRAFDYEPTWLRFGIPGSPDAWQRLEAALNGTSA